MRLRIFIAALLAGTIITPALAQDGENRRAERMERRSGGEGGGFRGRDAGGEGMRAAPERVERAPRQDWQQRQQAQPQVQAQSQAEPEPRRDWVRQRMESNAGGNDGGNWQRRQAPVANTPQAPVETNRGWRGNNEGGWQRRQAPVVTTPVTPPVVAQQGNADTNRGWRGNNDRTNNGNWRRGDRDNDGIRNGRDRDRDGDGVRNNRDWDRNNNGTVDRRWDRNNNGVVDRRFDRNRDGIRNNGGNWNNDRRYGNNQGWNRQWRNDNRYDWQRYRTSNRNLFRQPRYYSPYGYDYSYQRFGIGIYLDSVFFGSRYRINDPWQYRLPYAEWPYEWVRYYDDVLLVDTRNGYIVDVIHNFFW
jgi:Nickel/cobalt transporter regulator